MIVNSRVPTAGPQSLHPTRPLRSLPFALLAVLVGIVAGLGAVAFRGLIAFIHNLDVSRANSRSRTTPTHTRGRPWGALVILVPVVGAIGVAFLVKKFAPEAKGHGVPEVMDAIYYHKGVIRPVVALVKSLASALSIGSGGSVGREGPDHPDRLVVRLDAGADAARAGLAAHHADRRRRAAAASPRRSTRPSAACSSRSRS